MELPKTLGIEGEGRMENKIFRVPLLSARNGTRRFRHANNDKAWSLPIQSTHTGASQGGGDSS